MNEELGLNNLNYKKLDTIKFPYNSSIFNVFYSETVIDIDSLILQPDEVTQVKWYGKEEVSKLIDNDKVPKGYAFILKNYIK